MFLIILICGLVKGVLGRNIVYKINTKIAFWSVTMSKRKVVLLLGAVIK